MKYTFLPCALLLFPALFNSACNSSPEKQETTDTVVAVQENEPITDSLQAAPKDSTINKKADQVFGLYKGVIPCFDCKETILTVIFTPRRYHLLEESMGSAKNNLSEEEGYWRQDGNLVKLVSHDSHEWQFEAGENSIVLVKPNSKPGEEEKRYVLKKIVIGADNKAWMEKKRKGMDFLALGNEPFWALDLDKDRKIVLLIANDMRTVNFPFSKPINYGGTLLYSLSSGADKLKLSINPTFCGDGMSDRWYEYEVKLEFNDTLYKGCGVALRHFY